jgi:hypothetical protein
VDPHALAAYQLQQLLLGLGPEGLSALRGVAGEAYPVHALLRVQDLQGVAVVPGRL